MSDRGEFGKFVRQFVVPLLLVLGGGGLLTLARFMDGLVLGLTGAALIGVGLLWMFVSCLRNGIDFFDL